MGIGIGHGVHRGDSALRIDQVRNARHTRQTQELIGLPSTVRLQHDLLGIGQKWERQVMIGGKRPVGIDGIGIHAHNGAAALLQLLVRVSETAELARADRGGIFGVEADEQPLAVEILELNGASVLVG